ncbi:MAG TPA: sigma-70 family RNA polymerase sigma factor [Gemmatimonadaceae bacterium]|nr:sigma-70 family RNA polymerase sigma factor [Gemmatimonadaceae bacterium]
MRNGGLTRASAEARGPGSETGKLLRAYHERGDARARQRLVELYLPLVESFTRRYAHTADEHDDIYQVGCIGLLNAIDRFELSRGDELAAFAVPNIAGEIRRYLRDRGSVRLPRRILELRSAAAQAQGELRAQLGHEPTTSEIAAELEAEESDVALALDTGASQAVELQAEPEGADEALDTAEDRLFLSDAFRELDERERRIVFLRYIRDAEPDAIAGDLGISRRQLARTTEQALGKLRRGLEQPAAPPPIRSPEPSPHETVEPKMAAAPSADQEQRQIDQPYHIELLKSEAADGGWTAKVDELPGCTAEGASPGEAAARVQEAMRDWIARAVADGRDVPKPRSAASHSGRLLVRMPQSLHAELARAAEREEVSLNQFITSSLASAVSWRGSGEHAIPADAAAPRSRGLRRALMANIVLLVLIAVLAIVLLIVALSRG